MLCRQATRTLLLFAQSVPAMAGMQLTYAASAAADTVLFAYVFALTPEPAAFARAAGVVRASYHAGNEAASLVGEWWVEGSGLDASAAGGGAEGALRPLFLASWATATAALLLAAAALPPPLRPPPLSVASLLLPRRGQAGGRGSGGSDGSDGSGGGGGGGDFGGGG
ncbi:hypothetical protein EMIHUDRAFT_437648, partial [Emiliania huxleyi CCMP1516]|uniref:Uncharacterized protein n=2 Tax=Emiliania huxleyi TaxID=2903 RepID=A0A0D3IJG4_EMIH1